jgi:hypothetical protein
MNNPQGDVPEWLANETVDDECTTYREVTAKGHDYHLLRTLNHQRRKEKPDGVERTES